MLRHGLISPKWEPHAEELSTGVKAVRRLASPCHKILSDELQQKRLGESDG